MITFIVINGYSQNINVNDLLEKMETRTEIYNAILNNHEHMQDFMNSAKGNQHAMLMMNQNNQLMKQADNNEGKNENQMMGHDQMMGMNKGDMMNSNNMEQNRNQMMGDNHMMNMMKDNPEMMQNMMGSGMYPMRGQMMGQNTPMKKYGMMVNRLPNMQQQLSLRNDQVEKLLDLQTDFKKQQLDYQAELKKKQMKLKNLLTDNASASQVKNQMKACSETKINMKVAAYDTAEKMKAALTSEQKEQLQNMMVQQGGMMKGQRGMSYQGQGGMMQNKNNQ